MEGLIFVGILILFAIMESVSRSKKGKGAQLPPPEEWGWDEDVGVDEYDSPDDDDGIPGEPRTEYTLPYGSRPEPARTAEGSERMVPQDVWEEILDLAQRTRTERRPVRAPPSEPSPAPRPSPVHAVHLTHAEFGTDPSSRSDAGAVGRVAREALAPDARQAMRLLRGGGDSLRQAVILAEVLGPPAALREGGGRHES